eukprot:scaffold104411_cov29-Tisochrysis_lutea.AAC.2
MPVEDMNEATFMNLGRWLMENTSDKEVRAVKANAICAAPRRAARHVHWSGAERAPGQIAHQTVD